MKDEIQRYYDLYKKMLAYEQTLRMIEGGQVQTPEDLAKEVLNIHNPHRGCPNCYEDCVGWIVDGEPCNK